MSNKTTNYINPYKPVATLYKNGLDYIISCMTTSSSSSSCDCDCSDVTVDKLIQCVCSYLFLIKDIDPNDPSKLFEVINIRAAVTNAINGYFDYGTLIAEIQRNLQEVPVNSLGAYFDKKEDAAGGATRIKSLRSRRQLSLSIGRASFEYWQTEISKVKGASSSWSPYFDGNSAIDNASIPYWVAAAIFGTQYNYTQVNADDTEAVAASFYFALGGALVVNAGKVIFGWTSIPAPLVLNKQTIANLNLENHPYNLYFNGSDSIGPTVNLKRLDTIDSIMVIDSIAAFTNWEKNEKTL